MTITPGSVGGFSVTVLDEQERKALYALMLIYSDSDYGAMRMLFDGFVRGLELAAEKP